MISSGNKLFDNFFGGYHNEITVIYGPAGSGKTTLAKLAAIHLSHYGRRVLFIDSEGGFSVDRYKQLAGATYKRYLGYLVLQKPQSFHEQHRYISNILHLLDNIDLIIVDTIGSHYRAEFKKDIYAANMMLEKQIRLLKEFSKHAPVILTNQVYADIKHNEIAMIGKNVIEPWAQKIICLDKNPRRIILKKPEQKQAYFNIIDKGITLL